MNVLEKLLSNRWFVKAVNRDEYYQVKDGISDVQNFLSEKLGYHVIVNPYVIKLEKIPAHPENWMGIMEFSEPMEYVMFCLTLMFLEDKEVDGQFILSQLTEFIQSVWKQSDLDWTVYQNRRYLVKVLKYCVKCGILQVYDGSEDSFKNDSQADVLYLNTGVSRYFMRNFTRDITGFMSPQDFLGEDWFGLDEDRGIIRRQRVYRRLLMSMGMERTDAGSLSDIALLCGGLIRDMVERRELEPDLRDNIYMRKEQMLSVIERCKKEFQAGFAKTYRDMTTKEFCQEVMKYLIQMELVEQVEDQIRIRAVLCRMAGCYPADFNNSEGKMEEKREQ